MATTKNRYTKTTMPTGSATSMTLLRQPIRYSMAGIITSSASSMPTSFISTTKPTTMPSMMYTRIMPGLFQSMTLFLPSGSLDSRVSMISATDSRASAPARMQGHTAGFFCALEPTV